MAYDKYTWQTGEVITQEKLNHMEQGIEDGVNGYECTETREELFSETVTTTAQGGDNMAQLSYSEAITADTLIVTFDGVEYTCPKRIAPAGFFFYGAAGADDFSVCPFSIVSAQTNGILTETDGEHTIKAESVGVQVESISSCFANAVKTVVPMFIFNIYQEGTSYAMDCSFEQLQEALIAGRLIFAKTLQCTLIMAGAHNINGEDHYWFAGFAIPYSSSEIVVYDISKSGTITRKSATISLT